MRQGTGVISRTRRSFSDRAIAGGGDKGGELAVGHRAGIDKEAVDRHAVRRCLFRVVGNLEPIRNSPPSIHTMSRTSSARVAELLSFIRDETEIPYGMLSDLGLARPGLAGSR